MGVRSPERTRLERILRRAEAELARRAAGGIAAARRESRAPSDRRSASISASTDVSPRRRHRVAASRIGRAASRSGAARGVRRARSASRAARRTAGTQSLRRTRMKPISLPSEHRFAMRMAASRTWPLGWPIASLASVPPAVGDSPEIGDRGTIPARIGPSTRGIATAPPVGQPPTRMRAAARCRLSAPYAGARSGRCGG